MQRGDRAGGVAGSLLGVPQLVRPTALVRDSFIEAARDLRDEGWLPQFPVDEVAADFDGYVQRVRAEKQAGVSRYPPCGTSRVSLISVRSASATG